MRRDAQLWLSVLAGPTIWFAGMLANFALAPWACALGWKPALFAVTLVSLAVDAAAGLLAWRLWRGAGVEMPGEVGGAIAHERSLTLAGVLLSSLFFIVIVAQAVPNIILAGCD
jgi:hypothetical protein